MQSALRNILPNGTYSIVV